ncbi:MAG: peptidylprolyl isomerase [Candidatus Sumerlaeia bacterium]
MRVLMMIAAAALASAAFAQTSTQRTISPAPNPTVLPAQSAPDKPAFLEDAVVIDKKSKDPVKYRRTNDPYADLPYEMAEKLRQADLARQSTGQQFYKKVAEPVLSPDGQEVVGIVENRYLTKDQLKKRVDLLMKTLPPPDQSIKKSTGIVIDTNKGDEQQREEDRRILLEGRVLDDWAQIATLAVHAEHASAQNPALRVSDAEIDAAIRKLADAAKIDTQKIPAAIQSVMFSERELRQEVRDSLLIEKFMKDYVSRSYSEKKLKDIYEASPQNFLDPTKVHAWDLFVAKESARNKSERAKLKDKLGDWRGELNRSKTTEDFKALGERIQKETPFLLSDMGWVLSTDPLDVNVKVAVFGVAPGKTTKVIESMDGYHVIKVLERQDGDRKGFENGKPHVIDYLAERSRDYWYNRIKGQYGVKMAASGLKNWKVVGPAPDPVAAAKNAAATSSTATRTPVSAANEPSLDALRRSGYLQPGRGPASRVPSVEQVTGSKPVPPGTRRSGKITPGLTPPPMSGAAIN